jgi:signal transduction histidine kinase
MRLFFVYLKSHIKVIVTFVLFCCIFAVVFSLNHIPASAVGYAALICALLGLIIIAVDFYTFFRKHRRLQRLVNQITVTADNLPVPKGQLEKDYQNILTTLHAEKQRLEDSLNTRYTDIVEYYTIWAHQIKTPIAAMRLLLQSEDTPLNSELSQELARIEQYVEMVMCYLRLDSDSSDLLIHEYDLDVIIKQAVRKYASSFIMKKISLKYKPLNCTVLTDEKWLLFVIEQVLSNSLKYTKSGSIEITLEQPKTLCIRDTGIGIAPEDLPRVFEKGFTGCNGRSDKKASGIGLYLCRRIMSKLGHSIKIESEVGKGTKVMLDLNSKNVETD